MLKITGEFIDGTVDSCYAEDPAPVIKEYIERRGAWRVEMGRGSGAIGTALSVALPFYDCEVVGRGKGTQIRCDANSPATISVPSQAGFPTAKTVTTQAMGIYFHDQQNFCPSFRFGNFTMQGYAGTAKVAGYFTCFTVIAADVTIAPIWQDWSHSLTYDGTSLIWAPYKALASRNVLGCAGVQIGQDPWVEPDTQRARGVGCVRFEPGGRSIGEPLGELSPVSSATARATAYVLRKCAEPLWPESQIAFGEGYMMRERQCTDLALTGLPNADDSFVVGTEDPFTRASVSATMVWKASAATANEITLGADEAECIRNAVAKINALQKQGGGSLYGEALLPSEFMPGIAAGGGASDSDTPRFRFQALKLGEKGKRLAAYAAAIPTAAGAASVTVLVNTAGAMTAVQVFSGTAALVPGVVRNTYWDRILRFDDCFGGSIGSSSIGREYVRRDVIANYATTPNLVFLPDPLGERDHRKFSPWVGELNIMRCAMRFAGAGWGRIDGPMYGLTTLQGTDGPGVKGFITIEKGTHRATRLTFAGAPADTGIFRLTDGNGGDKTFEFNSTGGITAGRVEVVPGATAATAAEAARQAIFAQFDAHNLNCWPGIVINAGGGNFTLDVTFFTPTGEYEDEPTATKTATNLTITDPDPEAVGTISDPWKPRFDNVYLNHHALGDPGVSQVCSLWIEGMQEFASIHGTMDTMRSKTAPAADATSSQAVRLIGVNSVPAGDTTDLEVQSIGAGALGVKMTYRIRSTGAMGANTATVRYIDKTIAGDAEGLYNAILDAVHEVHTNNVSAANRGIEAAGLGFIFSTFWGINLIDGTDGVNALGRDAADTVNMAIVKVVNGGADIIPAADSAPGNADPSLSGKKSPIVLIENKKIDISDVSISSFVDVTVPQQLVYIEGLASGASRLVLGNTRCHAAFGLARTGIDQFVSFGPNISAADVTDRGGNTTELIDGTVVVT